MKIRVIDVARPHRSDINAEASLDVAVLDGHVRRSIASVTESLKAPLAAYSQLQRAHISWMFEAMGFTHDTIRGLLK